MHKPNILLVNVDSVNYNFTYDRLPKPIREYWQRYELPEAYAVSHGNRGHGTIEFFMSSLGATERDLDEIGASRDFDFHFTYPQNESLLQFLQAKGYTTIFGSDWPYTHKSDDLTRVESPLCKWCARHFDFSINTAKTTHDYDFNRLFNFCHGCVKNTPPWFMVLQAHDTHSNFRSAGVQWWDWAAELSELTGIPGPTLAGKMKRGEIVGWGGFERHDEIMELFERVRELQVQCLQYVLSSLQPRLECEPDIIFHILGDHATLLGETGGIGNRANAFFYPQGKYILKTMWLTNQPHKPREEYKTPHLPEIVRELFDASAT